MHKMVLLSYDRYQRLLSRGDSISVPEVEQNSPPTTTEETIPKKTTDESTIPKDEHKPNQNLEEMLRSLPKSLKNKVRALLEHLNKHTNLHWSDKGEIAIKGRTIPHSNIVDLIKVQLRDYKDVHPVGVTEFNRLLHDTNVPLSLLTGTKRRQTGSGPIPPPPGIPIKKKSKVVHKWLTY